MTGKRAITAPTGSNTRFLDTDNLKKLISGGQTGADQGGLYAARDLGFRTGGWIPKGFMTEAGPAPWLGTEFGLKETNDCDYRHRTILNIRGSDATMLFAGRFMERGVSLTFNRAMEFKKPLVKISLDNLVDMTRFAWDVELERARNWFDSSWETINIAGPRESRFTGAQELVHNFLLRLFAKSRLKQALESQGIVTDYIFSPTSEEV